MLSFMSLIITPGMIVRITYFFIMNLTILRVQATLVEIGHYLFFILLWSSPAVAIESK